MITNSDGARSPMGLLQHQGPPQRCGHVYHLGETVTSLIGDGRSTMCSAGCMTSLFKTSRSHWSYLWANRPCQGGRCRRICRTSLACSRKISTTKLLTWKYFTLLFNMWMHFCQKLDNDASGLRIKYIESLETSQIYLSKNRNFSNLLSMHTWVQ